MLRRRKPTHDEDEGDLSERLLPDEDSQDSHDNARHKQMIVYEPFSVEGFIRYILLQCQYFLEAINRFISHIMGSAPAPPQFVLTPTQQQILQHLQEKLLVKFDLEQEDHKQGLRQLWQLAFPGVSFEGYKCARWKDMGWQNQDPSTDFRGAGFFGLQNLVYMGTNHYSLFDKLLHKRDGVRVEWEYPFAPAGLNITFHLAQLLELQQPGIVPKSAAARAFVRLLEEDEHAFEEVYCMTYALLDQRWLATGASYMQFNALLKDCSQRLTTALESKPRSVSELRSLIGQ